MSGIDWTTYLTRNELDLKSSKSGQLFKYTHKKSSAEGRIIIYVTPGTGEFIRCTEN